MDTQAQGVASIRPGCFDEAARAAYLRAFDAKRDTTGGLGCMDAELSEAQLFDVVLDGQVICRYALRQVQRDKGTEVFIVAAAGNLPGVDLVASITPHIEAQCRAVDRLTINTRRRGLVKKLQRQGWTLDSYVMRKKINE